jgi:hypothetical protein
MIRQNNGVNTKQILVISNTIDGNGKSDLHSRGI